MNIAFSEITVMALGGGAGRILKRFAAECPAGNPAPRLLAVDTDADALHALGLTDTQTLVAGERWRHGCGCGGNPQDGRNAFSHERAVFEKFLQGTKLLFVVVGLGGGSGSGGAPIILSVARALSIPVIFLTTLPFSFEGPHRRRIASEVQQDLQTLSDALIVLPNDLLFSVLDPAVRDEDAFALADRECARALYAIAATLPGGNLLAADFNDLKILLDKRKAEASIGVGFAASEEGPDRGGRALERLFASPLLGGSDKLASADAVLLSLLGGPELSLGETRELLTLAQRDLSDKTHLLVSVSTRPGWEGKVMLTALAIHFEVELPQLLPPGPVETPRHVARRKSKRAENDGDAASERGGGIQRSLPGFGLETVIPCGVMEKTTPVIWRGENLDEPTFLRRQEHVAKEAAPDGTPIEG